jgi:phage terminase small subunit
MLSPKRHRFVSEYLVDMNAKQAAIRAGYSAKTAEVQGSRLLRNAQVKDLIDSKNELALGHLGITADRVLRELALMGFSNMMDFVTPQKNGSIITDFSAMTRDQAAAIQEVTVDEYMDRSGEDEDGKPEYERVKKTKFKLADKRGSLELLGKRLKLFTDKVEVDGMLRVAEVDVNV